MATVADGAPDAMADATVDAGPPFCDPNNANLIACYQFEGSTQDSSGHNLNATMTGVTFVPGRAGAGMAALLGPASAADVADSSLLDVAALTVEAWINPTQIPLAGERAGIVDCEGQFGFFLHETGRLQCTIINGPSMQVPENIATGVWTHVACTYDGTTTTIYANGAALASASGGTAMATNGVTGISIGANNPPGTGSRLVGLIDEVRMLDVARSTTEICFDAQCTQ